MRSLVESAADGGPEIFQSVPQRRAELARDLVAAGYARGQVVLPSGQLDDRYIDSYLAMTQPTVLRRLASLLAERIPEDADRIAGREPDAVPLTTALSLESGLPLVIVRGSGSAPRLRGELHADERVALVEPVVATAGMALATANALSAVGADIAAVLAVVDREQGGAAAVSAVVGYEPLFALSELPIPARPAENTVEESRC